MACPHRAHTAKSLILSDPPTRPLSEAIPIEDVGNQTTALLGEKWSRLALVLTATFHTCVKYLSKATPLHVNEGLRIITRCQHTIIPWCQQTTMLLVWGLPQIHCLTTPGGGEAMLSPVPHQRLLVPVWVHICGSSSWSSHTNWWLNGALLCHQRFEWIGENEKIIWCKCFRKQLYRVALELWKSAWLLQECLSANDSSSSPQAWIWNPGQTTSLYSWLESWS